MDDSLWQMTKISRYKLRFATHHATKADGTSQVATIGTKSVTSFHYDCKKIVVVSTTFMTET